jgi:RNA polymerase alpha subunit
LTQGKSSQSLEGLVGRVPDLEQDEVALRRAASGAPAVAKLARRLHSEQRFRQTPLGILLPGLEAISTPKGSFPPPISARSINCLLRAQIDDWAVIAGWAPADIEALPGVGRTSLEEILSLALRKWARFHLGEPVETNAVEIYDGLLALCAWGESTQGTRGAVAAIAAAAESRDGLPPKVERALRALRRIDGSAADSPSSLERAFLELEAAQGFAVFKRRQLEGAARPPTLRQLGEERGTSRSRAGSQETAFKTLLTGRMNDQDWPIRTAVEELRERLGAVARPNELDDAFAKLDFGSSEVDGHRRRLLLFLCDYRVEEEWVIGPDIEGLTGVILAAARESENADLDAACRQLTLLGVREEVQLGWILSRGGVRIIDGEIVPIE